MLLARGTECESGRSARPSPQGPLGLFRNVVQGGACELRKMLKHSGGTDASSPATVLNHTKPAAHFLQHRSDAGHSWAEVDGSDDHGNDQQTGTSISQGAGLARCVHPQRWPGQGPPRPESTPPLVAIRSGVCGLISRGRWEITQLRGCQGRSQDRRRSPCDDGREILPCVRRNWACSCSCFAVPEAPEDSGFGTEKRCKLAVIAFVTSKNDFLERMVTSTPSNSVSVFSADMSFTRFLGRLVLQVLARLPHLLQGRNPGVAETPTTWRDVGHRRGHDLLVVLDGNTLVGKHQIGTSKGAAERCTVQVTSDGPVSLDCHYGVDMGLAIDNLAVAVISAGKG